MTRRPESDENDREAREAMRDAGALTWGRGGAYAWQAPSTDAAAWVPRTNTWALPHYVAQLPWLASMRKATRKDYAAVKKFTRLADALRLGLSRHLEHLEHARRLIENRERSGYSTGRREYRVLGGSLIGSALEKAYGPDPRADFLAHMALCGILPSEVGAISAGNEVRAFHVIGDPPAALNGWAVLHRCPSAGSFGNWRTGAVHTWCWRPDLAEELAHQFATDLDRARQSLQPTFSNKAA